MVFISAPKESLFDEDVNIKVSNLEPGRAICLIAQTSRKGATMISFANYVSDPYGRVDVANDAALEGGTYEGIEPMGLFWSMQTTSGEKNATKLMSGIDIVSWHVSIQVHNRHCYSLSEAIQIASENEKLAEIELERILVPKTVKRIEVSHGKMQGMLLLPPGHGPFPAVISITGGVKGLIIYEGGMLASHGFACLCVAYAGYKDLPKEFTEFDVDYFNECYDFLAHHPLIDKEAIGVFGNCQGATMGLALARCQPGIKAVVALCPFPYAFRLNFKLRIGEQMITIPGVVPREELVISENDLCNAKALSTGSVVGDWRDHSLEYGEIKAAVRIYYGADDQMMDLEKVVPILKEQFERTNKTNAAILVYPDTGHDIMQPHTPVATSFYLWRFKGEVISGGTVPGNAKAQQQIWQDNLDFFRSNLVVRPK